MDSNKYMEGFVFCTRYYYRYGHLDIPVDAVTNKGFKIGQWLEDLRHDMDDLTSFQINDMSSIGMIWDSSKLGGHRDFSSNLRKLERIAKEHRGEVRVTDITDDESLKKWCENLPVWRAKKDNSLLTMRECELITSVGFIWRAIENTEYTRMTSENSLLVQAIRRDAMNILKEKGYFNQGVRGHKPEEDKSEKKEPNISDDWHSVLLSEYLKDKDKRKVTSSIRDIYIAACKISTENSSENVFLRMLNDGQAGFADWIVTYDRGDLILDITTCVTELNNWCDVYEKLGGVFSSKITNLDALRTERGATVAECLNVLKQVDNFDTIKDALREPIKVLCLSESKVVRKYAYKPVKLVKGEFLEQFIAELSKFGDKYGFIPNNASEVPDDYEDAESLKDIINKAYENKDWLTKTKFYMKVRRGGFFFYDTEPEKPEVAFRKLWWKFVKEIPTERCAEYPYKDVLKCAKAYGTKEFNTESFVQVTILANPEFKELWDAFIDCLPSDRAQEMLEFIPMYLKSMHFVHKRNRKYNIK